MTIEYPSYYDLFECIGGSCPDTCCAGWEVDVDEDSYDYYKVVPGEFGERLRNTMVEEGEEKWFPLTKEKRCPFLNKANLCDIYSNLGEESLCQVCTEYPRYYMEIGDYEQIDMSLSCMELGRIFFTQQGKIDYIRMENEAAPEEALSAADQKRLETILAERTELIHELQEIPSLQGTEQERLRALQRALQKYNLLHGHLVDGKTETFADLINDLHGFETINPSWTKELAYLTEHADLIDQAERTFLNDLYAMDEVVPLATWFTRLSVYLIYRYSIDSYLDGDEHINRRSKNMISRSLNLVWLLCIMQFDLNGRTFDVNDMIDMAHRFSKEVEHSEDNVERMKAL